MKLITKEIKKRLEKYPLYSQDGKKEEAICQAKFFLCVGAKVLVHIGSRPREQYRLRNHYQWKW